MNNIQNSLNLLNDFFAKNKVNFWLEAGSALAAFRDGKIFPWEHDIDVAIWRETMPFPEKFIQFFERLYVKPSIAVYVRFLELSLKIIISIFLI